MNNEMGEVTLSGINESGHFYTQTFATYTCGHCSNVIMMRPDRVRPRERCLACGRWLCEKSEICHTQCTPIHALAKDRFEARGNWTKYIGAIMQGVDSVAEAQQRGLIGRE